MSDERETLQRELEAARARIARLEQEAETNRAFFARTLSQAHQEPRPASGPTVWHALALFVGFGLGVFITLLLLVLRGEPPPMAPLPPPRKAAVLPVLPVRDAGVGAMMAAAPVVPAPAPAPSVRPDDRGTLNVTASAPAAVFIDGRSAGEAPVQASVRPGGHVVRVVCDGGTPAEHAVTVPPYADVDVVHSCD